MEQIRSSNPRTTTTVWKGFGMVDAFILSIHFCETYSFDINLYVVYLTREITLY